MWVLVLLLLLGVSVAPQHVSRCGAGPELLVVSRFDGALSAVLPSTGHLVWTAELGRSSLLSSTLTRLQFQNNQQLVPSLDGNLYRFNGDYVEPVPLPADMLFSSSIKFEDGTVIAGGKELQTHGIDINTGHVHYNCGINGCRNFSQDADIRSGPTLVLHTRMQTVRGVTPSTGDEKWHFSVQQDELQFPSSCPTHPFDGVFTDDGIVHYTDQDVHVRFVASEGLVLGVESTESVRWQHSFPSPISKAWLIRNGLVHPLDLFNSQPTSNTYQPILYVGEYKNQLYILEANSQSALGFTHAYAEKWPSFLALSSSNVPLLDQDLTATGSKIMSASVTAKRPSPTHPVTNLVFHDGSPVNYFENGLYIYTEVAGRESACAANHSQRRGANESHSKNLSTIDKSSKPQIISLPAEAESLEEIIIISLWHWWKEVLAISCTFAVLTNVCFTRLVLKRWKLKIVSEDGRTINICPAPLPCPIQTIEPPLSASNTTSSARDESTNSQSSTVSTPHMEFISRYLTDFEPIRCLGHGGFGVVFEARNKIDDCHYAVKRICLPNREMQRRKVLREVKALAKLDHAGIVRYYNAWLECPPPGWRDDSHGGGDHATSFSYNSNSTAAMDIQKGPTTWRNRFTVSANSVHVDEVSQTKRSWADGSDARTSSSSETTDSDSQSNIPVPQDATSDSFIVFQNSDRKENECDGETSEVNKRAPPLSIGPTGRMYLYIQMQLCRPDSLRDWLMEHKQRDRSLVLDYFSQIVAAVEYVHNEGLVHRDLKPSNIFFALDGSVKVGDFGLVTGAMAEEPPTPGDHDSGYYPSFESTEGRRHTDQVGTQLYMSPEQVLGKSYGQKVDIFSLGLILFEMLVPFSTQMERLRLLTDAKSLKFSQTFQFDFPSESSLVERLLAVEPDARPTAAEIQQEPLLEGRYVTLRYRSPSLRARTTSQRSTSSSSES